jgi:putative membrane protein
MAWIRTAISLISFGFTIHKFLEYVKEREGEGLRAQGPRNLGMSLILLGTGGLLAASLQHWRSIVFSGSRGRSRVCTPRRRGA